MQRRGGSQPTLLMTADAVGGVWSYALALCAALAEFRFVVAVMGPPPDLTQRIAIGRLGNVVLAESGCRLEWMAGAAADLAASRDWLAALARRHDAALLHVNGYAHARVAVDCPILAVAHSDVLSWWQAVHGEPAPAEWGDYRREVVAGLNAAHRIVAPTRAVLDDLAAQYGLRHRDALVIPNGIDLATWGSRPKQPVIMAAGRVWDMAKNLTVLDDIAAGLDWPVEIAGPTTSPEGGFAHFAAARLIGTLTPAEMAERLGIAAIFAAPARYEPFGLGILEAAASGCVLALGDISSLREIWGQAALFVPADDRAGWRDALRHLITDAADRERIAGAARRRAQRYSRERMAARYRALYRELLAVPGHRKVA